MWVDSNYGFLAHGNLWIHLNKQISYKMANEIHTNYL